jgi:spore maturation protein CgeB
MRIFYVSQEAPTNTKSTLWKNNLHDSLIDLGHEVITFPLDSSQNINQFSNTLFKSIKNENDLNPITLFFSYLDDSSITPETIDEIKALEITTVNWFCNASYQFYLVKKISPHYDYCLVPEKFRIKDYNAIGANPLYCQEAANPNIYKPYDLKKEFDVTFIGQAYGDRPEYVDFLVKNGIKINVWGPYWNQFAANRHTLFMTFLRSMKALILNRPTTKVSHILPNEIIGPPLSDANMIKMFSRSKINLGFSSCDTKTKDEPAIKQIRLRDFEVPMSGGFYMVEYMEELEEFFEIGKEIVCYENKEDLVEKIRFYLKSDSAREKIRIAGHKRCIKDHSWQKRFSNVFTQIFYSYIKRNINEYIAAKNYVSSHDQKNTETTY